MTTRKRNFFMRLGALICLFVVASGAILPARAAVDTVTVDMAVYGGSPTYRASGWIYGISEDATQPQLSLMTDIKVQHMRHGGSQIGCPDGGWVNGAYAPRRDSVIAYYNKAEAAGAKYQMILAGIWGADGQCNVPSWPGDNGDWTAYETFLNQVIDDVLANNMSSPTLRWDIWNEPNGSGFWGRDQTQYLEMWKRGYQIIRSRIPNAVIVGPSTAGGPGSTWWVTYLDYVNTNNVIPDIMSWHNLPGDPVASANTMNSMLASRGMSVQGFTVNEYGGGTFGNFGASDQQPGPSAWYIARLERCGCEGVRANWALGGGLFAGMGDLVDSNWQPLNTYWIYKRYADQTGLRTKVTAGSSIDATAFQDSSINQSIIVVGNNGGTTGSVDVVIDNIPTWLQSGGQTHVLVEKMPAGTTAGNPTVLSNSPYNLTNNSLTVTINWTNALDGYVITLTPASTGVPTSTPIPPPANGQYETEDTTWSLWGGGANAATDHSGYTGSGFIGFMTAQGAYSAVNVQAQSAGTYDINLRYSAGPNGPATDRTMSLYVNGTRVKQTVLPRTTTWDDWANKTETVTLNAGTNEIRYQFDSGDTGWINTDNIIVQSNTSSTPTPSAPIQYEAENAALAGGTCLRTDHTGYTGTGFVACYDATPNGRSTTFTVNAASAGNKTVTLRYSAGPNGPATDRTVSIYVNGTKIKQTVLVRTSTWDVWATKAETLSLNAGNNTIKYQLDSGDTGWINLDNIIVD